MTLNETIKKVLKEETIKDSLLDYMESDGVDVAASAVGGVKRLAKILELDLDDIETQEMLVKNFIQHTKVDDVEVLSTEERPGRSGGTIIKVYIKSNSNASNITSWYVTTLRDYLSRKFFPFTVSAVWEPSFTSSGPKISLEAELVKDDGNEDLMENRKKGPRELPNELKRRLLRLDDLISKVIQDVDLCDYKTPDEFINIVVDELLWELRDDYHGDLSKLDRFDVTQYVYDFKYRELEEYFLESSDEKCI
jgi:hypothetical protein